jgi:hypothetical protein
LINCSPSLLPAMKPYVTSHFSVSQTLTHYFTDSYCYDMGCLRAWQVP